MLKILCAAMALALVIATQSFAQNRNSSTQTGAATSGRTSSANSTTPAPASRTAAQQTPASETSTTTTRTRRAATGQTPKDPLAEGVIAAFDNLIEGIRRADVNAVTSVYWNSPQLVLFNYNGTVTKGWEQMRRNRESSYPELKDVKITITERRVQMMGRDGAVVTCLWTQSQTYRGTPETASGRMTLVFRRTGSAWKAIHLHTSTDAPDPQRIPQSEQTVEPKPSPTPPAKP
ncbi:MAG TPA: AtzH-like domain-containing protein [Pyrinomonadaceae bacterium]|nr:AtzH-like domain-containing protein [Pyrinomonadaceae bacterium]